MKSIFVINDNSTEAVHAVEFALAIAQKMQANILLANIAGVNKMISIKVPAGTIPENVLFDPTVSHTLELLKFLNNNQSCFKPEIEEFDISNMDESKMTELINRKQIWMMVKGI